MQHQTDNTAGNVCNWTKVLRGRMGAVVQTGCVLYGQHYFFFGYTLGSGLNMWCQQVLQGGPFMIKETISGLGLGPTAAGLGDIRLGMSISIASQRDKTLYQAGISQRGMAPFLFGPVSGRRGHLLDGTTKQFPPPSMERIDVHLLGWQCPLMLAVLSATTGGCADMNPVCSTIAGPGKAILFNKSLY